MEASPFRHHNRLNKPYLVLLEEASGRAAAYDADDQLLTEQASQALVNFALQRHVHCEPWDDWRDSSLHRQPPSWASPTTMSRCRLFWLRDGWSKFRDLLETPDA